MVAVPRVTPEQAEEIALRYYGVNAAAERLAAEHDDTFRLTTDGHGSRLLKISLADAPPGPVTFRTAILLHLARTAPQLPVQRVASTLDGTPEVHIPPGEGPARLVTMTTWLDGRLLGRTPATPKLRRHTGTTLAQLNIALRGLRHPGATRTHLWDLQNLQQLRPLLADLPGDALLPEIAQSMPAAARLPRDGLRTALTDTLDRFDTHVKPRLASTRTQVIHADFHGDNLLTDGHRITGILDFGDALTGPLAMDVGTAACYQLGTPPDLLTPALDLVTGYHAADPLTAGELALAAEFTLARAAARIIVSQWNAQREPANRPYLLRRTAQAIGHLTALRQLTPEETARTLRAACRPTTGM